MRTNEPRFAEFDLAEYLDRVKKVRALMEPAGLDALLLTTPKLLRYFAGGPLTGLFEDTFNAFFCLLPLDPSIDATLVMSSGREGCCRTSWVPDQRFYGYDEEAWRMNQRQSLHFMAEVIKEKGLDGAKIGIELDDGLRIGMTLAEVEELKAILPKVRWQSSAPIAWRVAEIKSKAELAKIRKAGEITNHAFKLALESAHTGMTEKDIFRRIAISFFEQGATATGFLAVFGGGERMIWADALPSDYRFQKGDLLMIDGGCQVDGYISDVSRMGSFGKPSDENRAMYEAARKANANAMRIVKPGVEMRELFAAGQQPYIDAGYGDKLVFGGGQLGHGIGLSLHEYPDISADSAQVLQPGMVISIEPAISDKNKWANSTKFFIVENNAIVTPDGHELLTSISDELQILD
ncbi:MAG: Xaa-Pro peptidase family protein [Phycisphaerae bacterium]